jgi:hypothetical protein
MPTTRTPKALVGRLFLIILWMVIVGFLTWPRRASAQGFTVSTSSGLEAVRDSRATDWWLSGAGLIDLDGDGDLDLFLSSHGSYGALAALNDGKGHFTLGAGTFPNSELHLPADVDGDGKVDFTATYVDGGGQWWLNRSTPGSVNFLATKVTRDGGLARQQALVDVDGDGNLDWLRGAGAGVLIDHGDGKGGFQAVTQTLANVGGEEIAIVPADVDGDGDQDLFVEWGRYNIDGPDGATRLYRNDGGGVFTDVTTAAGLTQTGLATQGVGDFDHDGDIDFIALEQRAFPHSIFLNDGHGVFTKKVNAVTGIKAGKAEYASWGLASMTDFDNDGIPDLIVDGRNYLHVLRGTGGGAFVYANATWGGIVDIAEASVDSGFTFGDIDGDGDLDIIGYKTIEPRYLNVYVNNLPAQNWVNVRPVGLGGNHPAAGAEVRVYAAGTTQLLWYEEISLYCKQVQQTYYAYGETERHMGLGTRASVDVTVRFHPSNKVVRHDGVAANSTVRISEDGEGTIVPPPKSGGTDAGSADSGGITPSDGSTAGPSGAAGSVGSAGMMGSAGSAGMTGSAGSAGMTGSAGSAGMTGSMGSAGMPGGAGTTGGAAGAGAPHEKGSGGCSCALAANSPSDLGAALTLGGLGLLGVLARRRARARTSGRA